MSLVLTDPAPSVRASWFDPNSEFGRPPGNTAALLEHEAPLRQFLDSLLVRTRLLKRLAQNGSFEDKICGEVLRELERFDVGCNRRSEHGRISAWTEAYAIELHLLLAEPKWRLIPEIEYRLSVAEDVGVRNIESLRTAYQQAKCPKSCQDEFGAAHIFREDDLRFILNEVVEQIQLQINEKHMKRIILRYATRNIVFAALCSFILFLAPFVLIFFHYYQSPRYVDLDIHQWVGFPLLSCLSAGLFGSYFSRLLYIQNKSPTLKYDELVSTQDKIAIIVRGSIGVCGAALVFFFLHSGIITGPLVPDINKFSVELIREAPHYRSYVEQVTHLFDPPSYPRLLIANKDLALLIVWGFFAGFSERLLPSILASTEGKLPGIAGGQGAGAKKR